MIISVPFIIHKHNPRSGSEHYDLRFLDTKDPKMLHSFAVGKDFLSKKDSKISLVKTRDHDPRWLTLKSYRLKEIDKGFAEIHISRNKYFDITFNGELLNGRYRLFKLKTRRDDQWLLIKDNIQKVTEDILYEQTTLRLEFLKKIEIGTNHVTINRFPINTFVHDVSKRFKTKRIAKFISSIGIKFFGHASIDIHKFFIPELIFILEQLPPRSSYIDVIEGLYENTWVKYTERTTKSRMNLSRIRSNMSYDLGGYQEDFLKTYEDKKFRYLLNGYILAFEQGLGKTFTSLALMESLGKESVIIVAPKSTLNTVWVNEINTVHKTDQSIWVVGQPIPTTPVKYYIVNYESLDKLVQVLGLIKKSKRIGLIVDESHNFKGMDSKRTRQLLTLQKILNFEDILLMSGTPIKALGTEMIPVMRLLDPLFDQDAEESFIQAFGLNTEFALEILKNRLGLMMHRKTKSEVLKLPPKTEHDLKVRIPNSKEYTIYKVKDKVVNFVAERQKYYSKEKEKYERMYANVIDYLKNDPNFAGTDEFNQYLSTVEILKKRGYNYFDKELIAATKLANTYEKEVIYPSLPNNLKKDFVSSKSVVKYVNLKIMGEVIGGLLNKLRSEMFSEMIKHSGIEKLIRESHKKTICFTTYKDVAVNAYEYLKGKGFNPSIVYGETSNDIKNILKKFKNDPTNNPLIATIQTMSTGVTLTEADTVIFLNKPWRYVDYQQASDRVHRIGQLDPVTIWSLILDTGSEKNLSTRMEEVVKWSKEMFEGIVGVTEDNKNV